MTDIKLPILYVRGFPFPGYPLYTKAKVESALDYEAREGDVFIVSYPKSGTTWVTYMLWHIVNGKTQFPSLEDMNYRLVPYMEMSGAPATDTSASPRLYKFHCSYPLIPKNSKAKYVYVYRNPKDTLVSRFFFTQEMMDKKLDLDSYVDVFVSGALAHGPWSDHVFSWYEHILDPNVLFVSYEQLHENRRAMLLNMASFLGQEYAANLRGNEELTNYILKVTSFEYMKENLPVRVPVYISGADPGNLENNFRCINFFRKGIVGDWKNHLSDEQSRMIDEWVRGKFRDSVLPHWVW